MWKVLDQETVIPSMGDVWAERMVQLSKRRKDKDRFLEMMREADVRHAFDAVREVHNFIIKLPPKFSREDLEFMSAFVVRLNRSIAFPVVEFEGRAQKASFAFTSDEEEDDYVQRKSYRSDYYDWMEKQARAKREEEDEQSF
jgi:hypothetical protein